MGHAFAKRTDKNGQTVRIVWVWRHHGRYRDLCAKVWLTKERNWVGREGAITMGVLTITGQLG